MLEFEYQVTPERSGGKVLVSYGVTVLTQILISGLQILLVNGWEWGF